ncbi:MAG: hypothetical protein ACJ71D_08395 [Nitrososphaera sp.]
MTTTTAIAFSLLALSVSFPTMAAFSQQVYESPQNNFRITLSPGYVIQDNDVEASQALGKTAREERVGYDTLATICLEKNSLPAVGGTAECKFDIEALVAGQQNQTGQKEEINIQRYNNLYTRPEFASVVAQNQNDYSIRYAVTLYD